MTGKMQYVVQLGTDESPTLEQVGGKGLSLILMTKRGFRVPPGFVLTADFFQPWFDEIQSAPEWKMLFENWPENLKDCSQALQRKSKELELDNVRRDTLEIAIEVLKREQKDPLFAVRSSSPEEDLEGASFAGGYVTSLGVRVEELEDAIRRSFASSLGKRVFLYKEEHGFPLERPRISVIVQKQISAQVAGVAFSLNPLNNCYDEFVINGNFGLGESVVSGLVSPDTFVVDKVDRTILEKRVGEKETAIWLDKDGGTIERPASNREEFCLSDNEALEIADMLIRLEDIYQKPIDLEWAFSNGVLYLLQARPITAYFPLPEPLRTKPREPKILYADLTLFKWGMSEPVSPFGTSFLEIVNRKALESTLGIDLNSEELSQLRPTLEGRTYIHLSNSMKLQGKKQIVSNFRAMDRIAAETIVNLDETEYKSKKLPKILKGALFKAISKNLGAGWNIIQAFRNPTKARQAYLDDIDRMVEDLAWIADHATQFTIEEFTNRILNQMIENLNAFIPAIAVAELARSRINALFKNEAPQIRDKVVYLERALPDNITIEMGLDMVHLSSFNEIQDHPEIEIFLSGIKNRTYSPEFLEAWDTFMEKFGFRCPMEMDPAISRYYEQPARLFEQLRSMAENSDPEQNPRAIFERAKLEREKTFDELLAVMKKNGNRAAKNFEKNYQRFLTLGGFRETPKYYFVYITDLLRRRVFQVGKSLATAGRLDHPDQAFDLTIQELDQALAYGSRDLRELARKNTQYLRKFRHVHEFPRIIDSRGRILRPPKKPVQEGELVGEPISPGTVRGAIKVLHRPDDKPLFPGEILVARATDPGWTPLFLNAAGIILEVGGMLQHGALVAREYGKPCVTGIENVTSILRDGQIVEMDGLSGVVRVV